MILVGGVVFDIGGSCWSGFGPGFWIWGEEGKGDEDILMGKLGGELKERFDWMMVCASGILWRCRQFGDL